MQTSGAVAIGECGLDYHYDNSPRLHQRRAFAQQLELARELGCPVVVHSRDAEEDTAAMISEAAVAGVRGVMHCFTGSASLADKALESGWYLSFSGIVTFPKYTDTDLLRRIPEDRILVESDSPYLAPVPYRGKRNEPAWVAATVSHIANLRGVSAAAFGAAAARNTASLFGVALKQPA